jgi:RNA polymerase sigma-70 factor (ECF subfamily)
MTTPCDERQLVAQLQSGSRDAFARSLGIFQDSVYNLAYRLVGSQDAEDVAQDALVEICNSIKSFQGKSSLKTWIYRVTMNVCLEHRRRHRPLFVPIDDNLLEEPSTSHDPSAEAIRSEIKNEVDTAIGQLTDSHREVVILHELHGLTYKECAEVLGCPVGTVKSRLSNAFVKLRQVLQGYAPEGEAVI